MSDTNTGPEAAQAAVDDPDEAIAPEGEPEGAEGEPDAERTPLEKARSEARNLRERAKVAESRADELARALFTARVAATGKLADATDLAYDADLLDDGLDAAIDALIAEKPHTKARRVSGDVGQGQRGGNTAPTDFSSLLR